MTARFKQHQQLRHCLQRHVNSWQPGSPPRLALPTTLPLQMAEAQALIVAAVDAELQAELQADCRPIEVLKERLRQFQVGSCREHACVHAWHIFGAPAAPLTCHAGMSAHRSISKAFSLPSLLPHLDRRWAGLQRRCPWKMTVRCWGRPTARRPTAGQRRCGPARTQTRRPVGQLGRQAGRQARWQQAQRRQVVLNYMCKIERQCSSEADQQERRYPYLYHSSGSF